MTLNRLNWLPIFRAKYIRAPSYWKNSCVYSECTLHQLSPYIGKLKSIIARDLIKKYTKPKDLIVDPFSGSGTIPLEAVLLNRNIFAVDVSSYASVLTRTKLSPPKSLSNAMEKAKQLFSEIRKYPEPDLRFIPLWVRRFFHPKTLKEVLKATDYCIIKGEDFLLSCILGILHHQRPGFLSYPCNHLVPYLKNKKLPLSLYPEMYSYRSLKPRLIAKIQRAYSRFENKTYNIEAFFKHGKIENIILPESYDCLITSPPYMNALDYERDNRLRIWFLTRKHRSEVDNTTNGSKVHFISSIQSVAIKVEKSLKIEGHCIFIIGEKLKRKSEQHPSQILYEIISKYAPSLKLKKIIFDTIPDIRRSRRNCQGVKNEHILIFQRK